MTDRNAESRSRKTRMNRPAARMRAAGLLFGIGLFGAAGTVHAQTTVSLVKNTGQSQIATAFALHNSDVATAFTTGSNSSHGYMLKEVDLVLPTVAATGRPTFNVAIWGSTSGGLPDSGNVRGTLQHPTLAAGGNRFTSSAGIRLNDSTTYFVVVDVTAPGTNSNSITISSTPSDDEDAGAAAGWSIADDRRQRLGAANWTTNVSSLRMDIRGYANSAPVCAAPDFGTRRHFWTGEVTVGKSNESVITPGAFNYGFNATGSNDHGALSPTAFTIGSQAHSIERLRVLTGGPNNGLLTLQTEETLTYTQAVALELHACNVAIDLLAPTNMPDPDGYDIFIPSTTLDWSTVATRTLYMSLPANNAATGAPEITGTAQVGETLTAGVGDIADADGLPTTTFPAGYEFQWVRVDGVNMTDISGATSQTYTLVDDDAGKTVKVKVSFKDQRYVASYTRNNVMVTDAPLETRESAASGTVTDKPGVPQSFTATAGDAQVTLAWTAPADDGGSAITKYQYRYEAGSTVADTVAWNDVPDGTDSDTDAGNETGVVVTSLVNGTGYAFEVRAVNVVGEGEKAGPRTATPSASDTTAPRIASIVRQDPSSSPTNANTLKWRVTFNENVKNVGAADFSVSGTTATVTAVTEVTASTVYDVTASGGNLPGLDATVTLSIASGHDIKDIADNALTNTTPTGTDDDNYVVDNTAPTVTISDAPATSSVAFQAKITFSEPVSGFDQADLVVGNGFILQFGKDPFADGTPDDYKVFFALIIAPDDGLLTLDVNANVATDAAGNGNTAAAQASTVFTLLTSNHAPVFADTTLVRNVAENAAANTDVGAVIPAATDDDGDILVYTMEGTDAASFSFDAATRQIKTKTGVTYDFEAKSSYSVTIKADDGKGGTGTVAVTIALTDVDEPTSGPADVSVADARVREGPDAQLNFVVTLSHGGNAVVVSYKTLSGTARKGVDSRTGNDFRAVRGELSFPRGVTSKTISVTVFNDSHNEGQETMGLQLTGVSAGGRIVDGNATGFIEDNPNPDGDGNTDPVFADTTLSRSIAENTAANVNVGAAIPAATDDDGDSLTYTMEGRDAASFDFDANARQIKTKTNVRYDFEKKSSYSVTIKVVDLRGGSDTVAVTVTLTDVHEPPPGPARVSVADARVREGPGATLEFVVTLSHGDDALVVWYETANGTATAGQDYTAASGELFFPPGVTSKTLSVTVLDDSHNEGAETMRLRLTDVTDEGRIVNGTALGIIENTDPLPAAWIGRLGRAAADNVIESVGRRWERAGQGPSETHLTLGGRRLDTLFGREAEAEAGPQGGVSPPHTGIGLAPANGGVFSAGQPVAGQPGSGHIAAGQPGSGQPGAGTIATGTGQPGAGLAGGAAGGPSAITGPMGAGQPGGQPGGGIAGGGVPGGLPGGLPGGVLTGGNPAGGGFGGSPGAGSYGMSGSGFVEFLGTLAYAGGDARWAQWLRQANGVAYGPRIRLRDALMNSSFHYSPHAAADSSWLGDWAAWGETASTHFSGAEDALSLTGDVGTAVVGFDSRRGRWLTGVALSYTDALGSFSHPTLAGGALEGTLTTLSPYAHFALSDRSQLWGVAGYGTGDLTLTLANVETPIETGLANTFVAVGGRTALSVVVREAGQLELAVRTDARFTQTTSGAAVNLMGAAQETSRVRAVLEGRGAFPLPVGGSLMPTLEAGLRYDGGDAETGAGVEMAVGLGYAVGRLTVQVNARGLLAHQDAAYEEWGYSAMVGYRPGEDGLGLSMNIGAVRGVAQSSVQTLWTAADAAGLARGAGGVGAALPTAQYLRTELGYGFEGRNGSRQWLPYVGIDSGHGQRAIRLGLRLTSGPKLQAALELNQTASAFAGGLGLGLGAGLPGEGQRQADLGATLTLLMLW